MIEAEEQPSHLLEEELSTFEKNYDSILYDIGGGSFQFWNYVFFMIGMLANNWFVNAIAFDEQMPDFECKKGGVWASCKPEEFCKKEIEHRINWESPKSLHNFVEKLNLECV